MPIHAAAAGRPPSIVSAQRGCACPTHCPTWCAYFVSKAQWLAHLDAAGVVHILPRYRTYTLPDILPDMVRMLRQQGAPGRRGSGVQDLVNSTKQFHSFSSSVSFITHKAHLDAAGVVHGPHALHLLVHHLREPPASPSIRKDRRPCGRGWHLVSATNFRRGRSSSRGGRPAGRRTSGEEQKVTMVESMSTKRMDCACTGWRG